MLDGVTPFPAEFAARYRELGYWEDRPLLTASPRRWPRTRTGR
jgi:non-ribosomal peptide synthetase component E (peptide arylation enzyme)